jgi:hypothetical protein
MISPPSILRFLLAAPALLTFLPSAGAQTVTPITPLKHAHAHNDYLHARPLQDALDQGFCSVEADIFLTPEGLLVAHEAKELKPSRTLQSLYLDPLRLRIKANGGNVYRDGTPFYLLIDVKTAAPETYTALDKLLASYADILSVTENGQFRAGPVTIILSGNRAIPEVTSQAKRYVAIDGRLDDLKADPPAHLFPWISANWTLVFKWKGDGPFPPAERQKLADIVRQVHQQHRKVRFWATPEKTAVWNELLAAEVDFINTDKLAELKGFLNARTLAAPKLKTEN